MEANSLKILAIDDNRDNLIALKAVVADRLPGSIILTALNGPSGIELARSEDPDVILLDIVMPRISGFAVCRKLKEDANLRAIPVLFLTALRTDRESRIEALESGGEGFLSKPFHEIELVAQIRAMARIKAANQLQRQEKEHLETMVAERTCELESHQIELKAQNYELEIAHARVKALLDQYTDLYDAAPVGYFSLDFEGTILHMNLAGSRLLGTERSGLLNRRFGLWVADSDKRTFGDFLRKAFSGRVKEHCEVELSQEGSEPLIVHVEGTCSADMLECRAAVFDITARRRAEEENRRLEEHLRQAQKMEAIGKLAGGVAHDFNNMLNVIIGYGELVLAGLPQGEPLADKVEEIIKAGQRSAGLTRQLLAFSRRQTLQPEVLDVKALLNNLDGMLRRLIGEDIELALVMAPDLGCVTADPGQIEQVVINMAINSRDAMQRGGRLILEAANVDLDQKYACDHSEVPPGKYVMISVTDTGCGMDEDTKSRIFEPFFTTKERGKGTGLGLSTVYGILAQSGGGISVCSEPGQGATFRIYLPRTEAEAPLKEVRAIEGDHRGAGEHILVAEDEPTLQDLIREILTQLNYKVTIAENGDVACFQIEENGLKPDLVITDVIMPGMNGFALTERLRKIRPDIKILYMSGYTDEAVQGLEAAVPGAFIQKPFGVRELVEKIEQVLQEDRTGVLVGS